MTLKFLTLQKARYIYDISRLKVEVLAQSLTKLREEIDKVVLGCNTHSNERAM
jgi:glutamate racemase